MSRPRGLARLATLLLLAGSGCTSCPPTWAEGAAALQARDGRLWAAASAGQVFVDADATQLALTRAARRLADALGLDVEGRLSVVWLDERLFVEAFDSAGRPVDLTGLELAALVDCGGRTYARLSMPGTAAPARDALAAPPR